MRTLLVVSSLFFSISVFGQQDLLSLVNKPDTNKKQFVSGAFKSTRVINSQSMEMLGKGVLDFRILHRFGLISSGINNLYGLDQATMRLSFDYGFGKNLMAGVGRSDVEKELDGFIKYRLVWQSEGGVHSSPVSVVLVSGMTLTTMPWTDTSRKYYFSNRLGFYNQIIIGRKFNEVFSMQVAPIVVHRNFVPLKTDPVNTYAVEIGARVKVSRHTALVADYHYIFSGLNKTIYKDPLSLGVDIETGGHVFQLHFSNATGLNEKQYITGTTNKWLKGEIGFGFNLSRVFTIVNPIKHQHIGK